MFLTKIPFWARIFIGLILGIGIGVYLHPDSKQISESTLSILLPWLKFPGDIFLNLLQMIMVPLVIASVALGVSSLSNMNELYKLGTKVFVYFVFTTMVAISIGVSLAILINPGSKIQTSEIAITQNPSSLTRESEPAAKIISEIIPKNIINAMSEQQMLSLVLLGIFLGIFFLSAKNDSSEPLRKFVQSLESFCIWMVGIAMKMAPFAVFGLMAFALTQIGVSLLAGLFYYIFTVLLGLVLVLIFYMVLVKLLGKKNPFVFLKQIREVQILGFSTSSSSSVLPISLKIAKEELKIQPKIADFVLPLGATVNMDGTALYQAVATIFLSQIYNIDFTFFQLILLVFTVTGASIGTAATPGVGIVILASILYSFQIPVEGIAILFGVDRFLDMCRTSVNLSGDLTASVIMNHLWKENK